MKPLFGTLNGKIAKTIAQNMPRGVTRIVEPFGDNGTLILSDVKPPRAHVLNIVDPELLAALLFVQTAGGLVFRQLRQLDWVSSPETFEQAAAGTDIEGPEFFWRWFYMKKFGMAMSPDSPREYDLMTMGDDLSMDLFAIPFMRAKLKKTEIISEDPMGLVGRIGGDFAVLVPKTPEETAAVRGRLSSLSGPYFFAAAVAGMEEIIEIAKAESQNNVAGISASSIMMKKMALVWNYDTRVLQPIDPAVFAATSH